MLWSDDSTLTASGVDVVRFLDTGRVPSLFRWKNVTSVFDACSILSNLPLEKPLPVHNYRDGVRRFAAQRQRGWVAYCVATGVIYLAAFAGIAVGSNTVGVIMTVVILAFTVAVVLGWAWVSAMAAKLLSERA